MCYVTLNHCLSWLVHRSVSPSVHPPFALFGSFSQFLHRCPCPITCDWCCRVYGLVSLQLYKRPCLSTCLPIHNSVTLFYDGKGPIWTVSLKLFWRLSPLYLASFIGAYILGTDAWGFITASFFLQWNFGIVHLNGLTDSMPYCWNAILPIWGKLINSLKEPHNLCLIAEIAF